MKTPRQAKKLTENDNTQLYAVEGAYGDRGMIAHEKRVLDQRAKIATAFAERWALVAAQPDGEDSAGRQKLRRLTAEELAEQACLTVEALYARFEQKGWILTGTEYADIIKALDEPVPES
jgi:hypothetical protein